MKNESKSKSVDFSMSDDKNDSMYMGTKAAAKLWRVEQDTVSAWCRKGKIEGANQDEKGSPWRIPKTAIRP